MNAVQLLDRVKTFGLIGIGTLLTLFAAWMTHIITCLANDQWGFLIAGALFFPIGIIHGLGLWVGIF